MKLENLISIRSLPCIAVVVLGFFLSSTVEAQNEASAAYNAWNSAFLVQANGQTYYATTLTSKGTTPALMYTGATDIALAEDAYQHSPSAAQQQLIIALLNDYLTKNGTDWSYDGWNDDIGWMVNAFIRGYQITGNSSFLTEAENEWNMGYNRGWDSSLGGGIWENTSKPDKEALSNNPYIFEAVTLYQITGDSNYLTKAEAIYSWVRANLVNTTNQTNSLGEPGSVNQGINGNGSLNASDNVYNEGTWVEAANALYRVTGNQQYYNDALLTINHRVNAGAILHSTAECCGNVWAYWFTLGTSQFLNDTGLWNQYQSWFQGNATAAWSERNSLNLTWNDWTNPTNDANPDAMEMESAAAIWQHLPPPSLSLSGHYEIQSVVSGMALNVKGASTANGAAVVQYPFISGQTNALWTFVPTGGGYYHIVNVNSGQAINVTGASVASKALIVQWPVGTLIPGNDLWLPVQNPDGTYSFYNLNSLQAINDPGSSTTADVQYDQWWGDGNSGEKFKLISQP
jgi:hypothetical protein